MPKRRRKAPHVEEGNPNEVSMGDMIPSEDEAMLRSDSIVPIPNKGRRGKKHAYFAASVDNVKHVESVGHTLVYLQPNETLYFHGQVSVRVVIGSAVVLGYHLDAHSHPAVVYSPAWQSAVGISAGVVGGTKGGDKKQPGDKVWRTLKDTVDRWQAEEEKGDRRKKGKKKGVKGAVGMHTSIITRSSSKHGHDAMEVDGEEEGPCEGVWIALEPVAEQHMDVLGEIAGGRVFIDEDICDLFGLPQFFPIVHSDSGVRVMCPQKEVISLGKKCVDSSTATMDTHRVLVCGSKGVGKSTSCRWLVNTMLNRCDKVAFLECDVGQTEFTPSGMLSLVIIDSPLLGPPHTHQKHPDRCFFTGHVTSEADPSMYIKAIKVLYQQYKDMYAPHGIPLLINTQGWIKGLGYKLLLDIVRNTETSDILLLKTQGDDFPTFSDDVSAIADGYIPNICTVDTVTGSFKGQQQSTLSASEKRALQTAAYFLSPQRHSLAEHMHMHARKGTTILADVLAAQVPYSVPWSKDLLVCFMYDKVAPSQSLRALNGCIVGLGVDHRSYIPCGDKREADPALDQFPSFVSNSSLCHCEGLGVIRSVDVREKMFYIITPVPQHRLREVNTLLRGVLQLPTILMFRGTANDPYMTSESLNAAGTGGSSMRSRSTLLRRRLEK